MDCLQFWVLVAAVDEPGDQGLGPRIQRGGRGIWFRVNSSIETDVRNRPSGFHGFKFSDRDGQPGIPSEVAPDHSGCILG